MGLDIRTINDADLHGWLLALNTGFLRLPHVPSQDVEVRRTQFDFDRTLGAFDDGRCVGTLRSFPQEVTAVGGAALPSSAITNVSVCATHRRRGLLTRMMAGDLERAKERGDVVASLIAAEYPIYGRYGFGPATWTADWEVDVPRTQRDPRWSGPEDGHTLRLIDAAEHRKLGPAFHERFRAGQPGAVSRSDFWWRMHTGEVRISVFPYEEPFRVVCQDPAGEVQGIAVYSANDLWETKVPRYTLTVRTLAARTPAAERALWHYLVSIDWVGRIVSEFRPPDDLLPLFLADPRAARITTLADFLWLRPLDVPRMLTARTYPTSGCLVLELRDAAGLAGGRYRLDATPDGASCVPTTASADLTMDIGELATLYLGDESATRLAALGRISEERTGALTRADVLLRTARRPWCPDSF